MEGRNGQMPDGSLSICAESILCLRGGGADEKRKAARKRKFASLQSEDSNMKTIERKSLQKSDVQAEPMAKNQRTQASSTPPDAEPQATSKSVSEDTGDFKGILGKSDHVQQKSQRFIVFIGNLPYTAQDASIAAHFAKVQPTSIRHRTNRETGKSKGFAFLEFAAYDRMKTCLKLYHHSTFDDGESPARKINVELTVGGGGAKSRDRKTKLQAKNWKLSEERKRRAEEEAKVEMKSLERKGTGKGKLKHDVHTKTDHNKEEPDIVDNGDIHPSRRSRMAGK